MKTITARVKVKVNVDRTVTVQFPADMQLPMEMQTGEYEAVLVLGNSSEAMMEKESSHTQSEQQESLMTEAWEKWIEEVEQLPLSTNPIQEDDYHQYLVEKYRKQGLVL